MSYMKGPRFLFFANVCLDSQRTLSEGFVLNFQDETNFNFISYRRTDSWVVESGD